MQCMARMLGNGPIHPMYSSRRATTGAIRRRRGMSTYLEGLKRLAVEHRARQTAKQLERSRSLEDRIRHWYEDLPPQERRTRYTMNQLVLLFGTAPGLIGAALHRLGWRRKRNWRTGGPYDRYWDPVG
jgi:hypothetical protein